MLIRTVQANTSTRVTNISNCFQVTFLISSATNELNRRYLFFGFINFAWHFYDLDLSSEITFFHLAIHHFERTYLPLDLYSCNTAWLHHHCAHNPHKNIGISCLWQPRRIYYRLMLSSFNSINIIIYITLVSDHTKEKTILRIYSKYFYRQISQILYL